VIALTVELDARAHEPVEMRRLGVRVVVADVGPAQAGVAGTDTQSVRAR
jgi:hypothetical protein